MGKMIARTGVVWPRVRGCCLASVSVISLLGTAVVSARAQPVGASVVAGQAQVSASGATTFINQSTQKAIINWQDFSVGAGAAVQFNQPGSSSITLNRVTGSSISTIDGAIRATGQVWLLNPNGLLFGNGSTINVGGLLATTSDLANQDFLNGRYNFSGGRNSVVNNGVIKASSGGSVVLSAPNVVNNGLIQANAGRVVLGGTDTFTVDFAGDHLLSYAIASNSSGGKVTNTGRIGAAGGKVLLTAKAASGVQDAVINNTGMVEATSVRQENGEIILEADDGAVSNSGTLDASGKSAGETGGAVKVLGKEVAVADGARIDVSGDAGGGTALIGGNFHGQASEVHAQNTTVGKAVITVDATTRGNGGNVAVWSDGTTQFAGKIDARGGANGGNGGQVETSGHYLGVSQAAKVTTAASKGTSGNWLLDPDNIIIATGGGGTVNQAFSTTGTVTVAPATIITALGSGNVTLQANIDITVNNPVNASTTHTLALDAGHSIILNANLQNSGGGITLIAGDVLGSGSMMSNPAISAAGSSVVVSASRLSLVLRQASGGIGASDNLLRVKGVDASGQPTPLLLSVDGGSPSAYLASASDVDISSTGINIGTGTLLLTASGSITQEAGGAITANQISLGASGGSIGGGSPITVVSGGAFPLSLSVNTDGGDASIASSGPLSIDDLGSLGQAGVYLSNGSTFGNFTLTTVGTVVQTAPIISNSLSIATTGGSDGITLDSVANSAAGTVNFSTQTGTALFTSSSSVTLGSSIVAGDIDIEATGNSQTITLGGGSGVVTAGGTMTLHSDGDISQAIPFHAGTLNATSDNGRILLNDVGNGDTDFGNIVMGSVSTDGADTVFGTVTLSGVGSVNFTNHADTVISSASVRGDSSHLASMDIEALNPFNNNGPDSKLYVAGNLTSQTFDGTNTVTGTTILHAVGDIVNLAGRSTISGDALSLQSDNGNIGGSDPNGSGAYFIATTIKSMSVQTGGGASQFANISNNGNFSVGNSQGGVNVGASSILLGAANGFLSQTDTITAGTLTVSSANGFTLDNAGNNVGTLSAQTPGPGVFVNSRSLILGQVDGDLFTNSVPSGNLIVQVLTGDLIQDTSRVLNIGGAATFKALSGNINLNGAGNLVRGAVTLESQVSSGTIAFNNNTFTRLAYAGGNDGSNPQLGGAININVTGSLQLSGQVLSNTSVSIVTSGDIILNSGAVVDPSGGGDSIILAAGGHFINNAGANALVPKGGGRFLIYSADPAGDVFGGLDSGNDAIFATRYPTTISGSGNRYVFALQPTITVSATSATKLYGTDNSASLQSGYTISGRLSAVAGAYTIYPAMTVSGSPVLTSVGSAASAGVGIYSIAVGAGSLAASGYALAFQNGLLKVTPESLVYTADAASRTYGAANPPFSGMVTGFVNGDTLTSATNGKLVFVSAATAANSVGNYAILGTGLLAANYVFVQASKNFNALTITPATLLYNANPVTRGIGDPNPLFSGFVSGFLNSDTLTSTTSGRLVFATTAVQTSPAGSYAVNGSGLSALNYVFAQAPGNASALTIALAAPPPTLLPSPPTVTGTLLASFTSSIRAPSLSSLSNTLLNSQPDLDTAPPTVPPPPPPPLAPDSPLAANNTTDDGQPAEAPISSDHATSQLASSLEGGAPGLGSVVFIPRILSGAPPPPTIDNTLLPSFGNMSLWQ
jgi:filamentous hemagglutinin family protein